MRSAELKETPVQGQKGRRVIAFCPYIHYCIVIRDRQPRLSNGESRVERSVPLHRRPAWISPESRTRHVFLKWVLHAIRRNGHIGHANLIAVVRGRRPAQ